MPDVHPITFNELERLGVDDDNRLYWDGEPVGTEQRVALRWWVNLSVIIGGVSTLVLAVLAVLRFFGYGAG